MPPCLCAFPKIPHHIDIDFDRFREEPVNEHRRIGQVGHIDGGAHVSPQRHFVEAGFHPAPAQDIARANQHRIPDSSRDTDRLVQRIGDAVVRLGHPQFFKHHLEPISILRQVDRIQGRADEGNTRGHEAVREVQRRLPAELHNAARHLAASIRDVDPPAVEPLDHVQRIFQRQRLEEQEVRCVVIRAHRLRIRVDHHRLESHFPAGERSLAAAVVKLDALADAVRPAPEDDDLAAIGDADFILADNAGQARGYIWCFVRRVVVRRQGFELGRARVHQLVHRLDLETLAVIADF